MIQPASIFLYRIEAPYNEGLHADKRRLLDDVGFDYCEGGLESPPVWGEVADRLKGAIGGRDGVSALNVTQSYQQGVTTAPAPYDMGCLFIGRVDPPAGFSPGEHGWRHIAIATHAWTMQEARYGSGGHVLYKIDATGRLVMR